MALMLATALGSSNVTPQHEEELAQAKAAEAAKAAKEAKQARKERAARTAAAARSGGTTTGEMMDGECHLHHRRTMPMPEAPRQ